MNVPDEIKVGPYTVTVRFDKDAMSAAGANGTFLPDSLTILLQQGNAPLKEKEVVLHEVMHAIWNSSGLATRVPDADEDSKGELAIQDIAPLLLGVLRDNPELTDYLVEGAW